MKRRTEKRTALAPEVPPGVLAFLEDAPAPEPGEAGSEDYRGLEFFGTCGERGSMVTLAELWAIHGAEITARWIVARPGTRPSTWWAREAPPEAALARWAASGDDEAGGAFEYEGPILLALGVVGPDELRALEALRAAAKRAAPARRKAALAEAARVSAGWSALEAHRSADERAQVSRAAFLAAYEGTGADELTEAEALEMRDKA